MELAEWLIASDSKSDNRVTDSGVRSPHSTYALVAQLVAHGICNAGVASPSLAGSSKMQYITH